MQLYTIVKFATVANQLFALKSLETHMFQRLLYSKKHTMF